MTAYEICQYCYESIVPGGPTGWRHLQKNELTDACSEALGHPQLPIIDAKPEEKP